MNPTFPQRLAEVNSYFEHGDHHLGYRRLMDAAIETENFDVYQATLDFCDWYDVHSEDKSAVQDRVKDLLILISNGYHEPAEIKNTLRLKATEVSKKYSRGNFSLSPLNLELHLSEIIGLVGENGNGKTTLLRLLNGELEPNTGRVHYEFALPGNPGFYETKSRISFIPQRPLTWYGSLMENLQYASTYTGLKGRNNDLWTGMIIARMGLRAFRTYNWSRISSGFKMRFELARTIICKPDVLLLDEPLANLDVLAQQIILEDLRFLAQSHTRPLSIILSSQQLYEVEKVSDQVIFLQKGVAKYQSTGNKARPETYPLILELETAATRETLLHLLLPQGLQKLSFNGGVYILYFGDATTIADILTTLGQGGLPVKYLRDISISSRRFFDA